MKIYLVLLVGLLLASCKQDTTQTTALRMSEVAAPSNTIKVVDFNGLEAYLNQSDGKTYVINFWATWCKPCIKELPYFEQLREQYGRDDVEVILVSLDFPEQLETGLKKFVAKKKLQSTIILLDDPDANGWIPKVDESWSGAIPATIIYNNNDRAFYERSFSYQELEEALKKIKQ